MTTKNPQKKSTSYKILIQIGMKLHNPQVIDAYREYLDGEEQTIEPIYSKYLRIYPEDSVWEILIKFCLFYLVDGRMWVQSSTPMWWAQKGASFKPQLAIHYRPVGKRPKFGYRSYAGNPELHIPHYNGDQHPKIPSYTIGKFSAQYILTDQTYLMVNASSMEEAIEVVIKMAEYTKPDKRPDGQIKDNLDFKVHKKKPRMDGIKIAPYKAEYFEGGKQGIRSRLKIQL
jgi:hypothetical protein